MATDKHTQHYTAADIEKYHKGLLSAKEMHDLEKAALDDPFLADALEGYATRGVNVAADIAELKKRLEEKTEKTKVVPLSTGKPSSFPFLRVAAMVILIAGAGVLTYQFAFNNKNKSEQQVAKLEEPAKNETIKANDTVTANPSQAGSPETSGSTAPGTVNDQKAVARTGENTGKSNIAPALGPQKNEFFDSKAKAEEVQTEGDVAAKNPAAKLPGHQTDTIKNYKAVTSEVAKENISKDNKEVVSGYAKMDRDSEQFMEKKKAANANANASRKAEDQQAYRNMNTFRGRVTDNRNVGVPFANVTNLVDNNAGTYTDANGYFNLRYADTLLNVQVRSVGFENNTVLLRNNLPNNPVVMQEDRRGLSEVVISNKQVNTASRSLDINRTLEEPEPADGWSNYDTYIANNLNVPEEARNKPSSSPSVEISFEVDKNGEPTNFKVEKSLCPKCDQEAIRLIKEGPKWKRKAKKNGRTTVTISF